jgi:hypothetical protein
MKWLEIIDEQDENAYCRSKHNVPLLVEFVPWWAKQSAKWEDKLNTINRDKNSTHENTDMFWAYDFKYVKWTRN